jgi:hypothetical protein
MVDFTENCYGVDAVAQDHTSCRPLVLEVLNILVLLSLR